MDNPRTVPRVIEADGLSVSVDGEYLAASLRYFDAQGSFASLASNAVGAALPQPLHISRAESPTSSVSCILVWRSPTETWWLSKDAAAFARLQAELAVADDGCLVDQTGGLCVVRVQGRRTDDLLARLGADSVIPGLGEARTGRLAEVQVTAVRLQPDELWLIVERVYADHLLEWITVTARDF